VIVNPIFGKIHLIYLEYTKPGTNACYRQRVFRNLACKSHIALCSECCKI